MNEDDLEYISTFHDYVWNFTDVIYALLADDGLTDYDWNKFDDQLTFYWGGRNA